MMPGMTAYLPPTKSEYNEPKKTNNDCNKKEEIISIDILSFFLQISYIKKTQIIINSDKAI